MRSHSRTAAVAGTALIALLLAAAPALNAADAAEPRSIKIVGTDLMQFSVKRIEAKAGEKLKIVLTAQGTMPKSEMAHNWVLLVAGAKVDAFILAAAMERQSGYIPAAQKDQILAATGLAGAGETVSIELEAPKVPGEYIFVCTFPGHYAGGMKGKLVVSN